MLNDKFNKEGIRVNFKSVTKHSSFITKQTVRRKGEAILFVLLLGSLVTGCSQTEPEDKNIIMIQTVLEHDFNIPGKEYIRMFNDPSNRTIYDLNGLVSAPVEDNEFDNYLQESYKPFFTNLEYGSFVPAFAFEYHVVADTNGYQITGDKMKAEITGLATCQVEGKTRYNKDFFLFGETSGGK